MKFMKKNKYLSLANFLQEILIINKIKVKETIILVLITKHNNSL